jgi:hypothetical protein
MRPGNQLPDEDDILMRELAEGLAALSDTAAPEDIAKWFELLLSGAPAGPLWDRFKVCTSQRFFAA